MPIKRYVCNIRKGILSYLNSKYMFRQYLFQFAISTIEGCVLHAFLASALSENYSYIVLQCRVKSDALFSYQPPFNILAFLVLKPASYIISPRSLHSCNVFLIKLTSLPILIVIGLYERYFAAGQKLGLSGKDVAQSFLNSLPRRIKNLPIMEAFLGSASSDLYGAIFDMELTQDFGLFEEESDDDELHPLRSFASRDSLRRSATAPVPKTERQRRKSSIPRSPTREQVSRSPQRRSRVASYLSPRVDTTSSAEVPSSGSLLSPLTRLFAPSAAAGHTDAGITRMEALLDDIRELPVQKIRDEMKELQVSIVFARPFPGLSTTWASF